MYEIKTNPNTVLIAAFGSEPGHVRLCKEAVFVELRILGDSECLFMATLQFIGPLIFGNNFVLECGMFIDFYIKCFRYERVELRNVGYFCRDEANGVDSDTRFSCLRTLTDGPVG
jgi:hypothetical protein